MKQLIQDRISNYELKIGQEQERIQIAYNVISNIRKSHYEPAHELVENANLKEGYIVESDLVFLKLKKSWMDQSFSSTDLSIEAAIRINQEAGKLRSRTMDEKTYTAYLQAPESEIIKLLFKAK